MRKRKPLERHDRLDEQLGGLVMALPQPGRTVEEEELVQLLPALHTLAGAEARLRALLPRLERLGAAVAPHNPDAAACVAALAQLLPEGKKAALRAARLQRAAGASAPAAPLPTPATAPPEEPAPSPALEPATPEQRRSALEAASRFLRRRADALQRLITGKREEDVLHLVANDALCRGEKVVQWELRVVSLSAFSEAVQRPELREQVRAQLPKVAVFLLYEAGGIAFSDLFFLEEAGPVGAESAPTGMIYL